jgi:glycosyltransferase involved in cell wall biosynthesis
MNRLRVCWFGIYDPKYPRNDILLRGLRAAGVGVVEIQADWKDPHRYAYLRKELRDRSGDYDLIYTAYPATVPTIWAKLLTRKPVVMDALYSMYDAVVQDRKEIPAYHPRAIKLWVLDWLSALLADCMIVDTGQHQAYWARFPFVRRSKIHVVYTGVQDHIFKPGQKGADGFLVSFHGFYIPLQGVDKIVKAAALLRNESIRFRLIGSGQLSNTVDALIKEHSLVNIEQTGRKTPEEIARLSQEADVVLGIFGDSDKARRVIPNKLYEGLAMKKAVITADTPAVREIFDESDLILIENTPEALAGAIRMLEADIDLRARIAANGYEKVLTRFAPAPLGKTLASLLLSCCGKGAGNA